VEGEFMTRQRPDLTPTKCYVGQRVYWVMWCGGSVDENDRAVGWFRYKPSLCPEIWSGVVDRLARNAIMLLGYGRAGQCYATEIEAIRAAYEKFICHRLCLCHWSHEFDATTLGEASRVLRLLAELEYGLHNATNLVDNVKA
jgi:hypothetical protein